jgi:hypothetical protein
MYYHLSDLGLRELPPLPLVSDGDNFLALASSAPSSSLSPRKCSFLETYVGVATITLLRALQSSRVQASEHAAVAENWLPASKVLAEVTSAIVRDDSQRHSSSPPGSDDCEVLYGRAGFLYSLLRLHSASASYTGQPSKIASAIGSVVSDASLKLVIESIIMRGQLGAQSYSAETADGNGPALMWSWHGKRYLGSAHGVGEPSSCQNWFPCVHFARLVRSWNPSCPPTLSITPHCTTHDIHSPHCRVAIRSPRFRGELAE